MEKGLKSKIAPFLGSLTQPNPFWTAYSSPAWYLRLFKRRGLEAKSEKRETKDYPVYIVFTCDLELDPPWNTKSWNKRTSFGLERGIPILLGLLEKYKIQATFFSEGRLAKTQSGLIKELKDKGHEIGCHGYAHESYGGSFRLDPFIPLPKVLSLMDKKRMILLAKDRLEKITNTQLVSFRAPFLHIDSKTVAILDEVGFLVDSSLYNNLFGKLSNPYHPLKNNFLIEGEDANRTCGLLEIPVTVNPIPRLLPHTPYQQIYPKEIEEGIEAVKTITFLSGIKKIPVVILLLSHPWEFIETRNPLGIITGSKREEVLDGFFEILSSLNNPYFVTVAQMRQIWEDGYCPIHAKVRGECGN